MMVNYIKSGGQIKESGGTELPLVKVLQPDIKKVLEGCGSGVMAQEPMMVRVYEIVILARAAALQSVAVRRLTGNDVSGPLF